MIELEKVVKSAGMRQITSNTYEIKEDDISIVISVSSIVDCTNICLKTSLNYPDDKYKAISDRVNKLNYSMSPMSFGLYCLNPKSKELELRTNMWVDVKPTKQKMNDLVSTLIAQIKSSALFVTYGGDEA